MFAEQLGPAPASAAPTAAAAADLAPGLALLQQTQQPGETASTQRPHPGRKGQSKDAAPAEAEQGSKQPAAAASLEGGWSLLPAEPAALRSRMAPSPPHRAQQATAAARQGTSAAAEHPAAQPGGGRGQQPTADRQGAEVAAELLAARLGLERAQQPATTGKAGPWQAEVASVQAGLGRLQQLEGRLSTARSTLFDSAAPSASQHAATQPQGQNLMPAPQGRAPMVGLRQDGLQGSRLAHSETARCAAPADTAEGQLIQNGMNLPVQSAYEAAVPAPDGQQGSGQAGQAAAAKSSAAAASTLFVPSAGKEKKRSPKNGRRRSSSGHAPAAATNGARSASKSKSELGGNLLGSAAAGSSPVKQMSKRQ